MKEVILHCDKRRLQNRLGTSNRVFSIIKNKTLSRLTQSVIQIV